MRLNLCRKYQPRNTVKTIKLMGRKPILPNKVTISEFMHYYNTTNDRRDFWRINAIWDLISNKDPARTRKELAEQYFTTPRTIQRLVKLYSEQGFDGVVEHHYLTRGRKPVINKSTWHEKVYPLIESLRSLEDDSFSAKKLHRLLTEEYGVNIKHSTLIKTLHRKGIYPQPARRKKQVGGGIFSAGLSPNGLSPNGNKLVLMPPDKFNPEPHLVERVVVKIPWLRFRPNNS
jgi:transposase